MIKIIETSVKLKELKENASSTFGDMVKAVVDIEKEIMALYAELHSDEEAILLENGSKQENLWGINIYPDLKGDKMVEFDSMINLRPSAGNLSRSVEDKSIQKRIIKIVNNLIQK